MKRYLILAVLAAAAPLTVPAQDGPALETNLQKFSYAMGYRAARDLLEKGVPEVDAQALAAGVVEAMSGKDFRFSREEMSAILQAYGEQMQAKRAQVADANKQVGDAFMAANGSKQGVEYSYCSWA